jgi:hypothetical protein
MLRISRLAKGGYGGGVPVVGLRARTADGKKDGRDKKKRGDGKEIGF